jgi:hypothetical protein
VSGWLPSNNRFNTLGSRGKEAGPHFLANYCPDLVEGYRQKSTSEESTVLLDGGAIGIASEQHTYAALRGRNAFLKCGH